MGGATMKTPASPAWLVLWTVVSCSGSSTPAQLDVGPEEEAQEETALDMQTAGDEAGETMEARIEVTFAEDADHEVGPEAEAVACECTSDKDCEGRVQDLGPCRVAVCSDACTCVAAPVEDGKACDDGNPCTALDVCKQGECASGENQCQCQEDQDCNAYEDGDLCNGTLYCNKAQVPYRCEVDKKTVVHCDLPLPCAVRKCVPKTGECVVEPTKEGEVCDDQNPCTTDDACHGGVCVGTATLVCNDNNPCTADACVFNKGCVFVPIEVPCDDGEVCTVGDMCKDGACIPGPRDMCDDSNECTMDQCVTGVGCEHTPIDGAPCDDHNACTGDGECKAGQCVEVGPVNDCDDGLECTKDSCDPKAGCKNVPRTGEACDDHNLCTVKDTCDATGACVGEGAPDCDDKNECTKDSCDQGKGCIHEPRVGETCDDRNACTLQDACDEHGACVGSGELVCDDGKVCTEDTCDPTEGCENMPRLGEACDDQDPCTFDDRCTLDGECRGQREDCTPYACGPDGCLTTCAKDSDCDQTTPRICQDGACVPAG